MAKTLTVVSKWENAPGYRGDLEDSSMALSPMGYRGAATWNNRANPAVDFIPNGFGGIIERTDVEDYFFAYRSCAPLQAIINKIAQAHANAQPWILTTGGKGRGKESFKVEAQGIRRLLNRPNPLQTQDEFEAQGKIYQKIFGYNAVYVLKPAGYANWQAEELWNIPACMLDIRWKNRMFMRFNREGGRNGEMEAAYLTYGGERVALTLDNLYLQKDFTPSFDTVMLPESRIRAVSPQIENILAAYNSRGALIHDRGAQGIISSGFKDEIGTREIPEDDINAIQRQSRNYGISSRQFRYIITRAPLQFTQVGFSTKDLMLFEEIEDDINALCNAFDYPSRLMGVGKTNALSQSDVEGFNKILYQDNIIPQSKRDAAFWNSLFGTSELSLTIEYDFSHLPVLQEDLKGKGDARDAMVTAYGKEWEMGACSINEMRIAVGDDPITVDGSGQAFADGQNPYNMYKPEYDRYMRDNGLTVVVNTQADTNGTDQRQDAEAED